MYTWESNLVDSAVRPIAVDVTVKVKKYETSLIDYFYTPFFDREGHAVMSMLSGSNVVLSVSDPGKYIVEFYDSSSVKIKDIRINICGETGVLA